MIGIKSHGREILRDIRAKKWKEAGADVAFAKLWGRSAVLAVLGFVLFIGLLGLAGTADYQACLQHNIC